MRYVKLFMIITAVLAVGSGLFVWLSHVGEVATLSYVPDPEWSKRSLILPYIEAEEYRAVIDHQRNLHLIWLNYNQDIHAVSLMHMAVNNKGKSLVKPHEVLRTQDIDDYSLTVLQGSLAVLWDGQGDGEQRDLNYLELSVQGEVVAQRKILTGELSDLHNLQAVILPSGDLLAVWADRLEAGSQIQTLVLDDSGLARARPGTLSLPADGIYPKLALGPSGQIHLTWQQEMEYSYGLYYLQLTDDGRPKTQSLFVDEIDLNFVSMAATAERVFIAWSRRMPKPIREKQSIIEKSFPNYVIFGTTFELAQPVRKNEAVQLTDVIGPAFDQNLVVDKNGQVDMLYVDTYGDTLGLTQQNFGKDFTDVRKASRRLYPDQRVVLQTVLLADPEKGMHLVWMQSDMYSGVIYYANNIYGQWVNPLQVIGLNGAQQGISALMSLGYILGVSFYSLFMHLHLLLLAILGAVLKGLLYLFRGKPAGNLLGDRFVVPLLLAGVTTALYLTVGKLIGVSHWIIWPELYNPEQVWFILLLATIGTAYYIIKGKIKHNEVMKLTIAVMLWFYWIHLINFVFNLSVVNFI